MKNSITFRLNPKHAEDREIMEWLDANAAEEGGQTALLKSALVSVIHDNKEADYYLKMQYEIQKAISKENEIFSDTVKEVMQSMVNQMFAGSLAMIGQTQKPLQAAYPQQLYSSEAALDSISSTTKKHKLLRLKTLRRIIVNLWMMIQEML